tara:strand:+ start:215 stop:889 length:675 start_codon:yes stop_codon:yes gene_type:complete
MKVWLFGDSHTNGWYPEFNAMSSDEVTNFAVSGSNSHHWQNGVVPGQEQHPGEGLLDLAFDANPGVTPDVVVYAVGANDAVIYPALDINHPDKAYYEPPMTAARNRANIDRILEDYDVPRVIWARQGFADAVGPQYHNGNGGTYDGFLCNMNIHAYQQWEIERLWSEQMVNLWIKPIEQYAWSDLTEAQKMGTNQLLKVLACTHHNASGRIEAATRVLNALSAP